MEKEKLMILAAGPEQIPLIKAAKDKGIYTIIIDENPNNPGMALADKAINIDILDESKCISVAKQEGIHGVVSTALSLGMRTVGAIAEELNLPGLKRSNVYLTTNKIAMRKKLCEKGFSDPPFRIAKDYNACIEAVEDLGLPLVFKPADGAGSRGVRVVTSYEEIETAYYSAVIETRSYEKEIQILIEKFIDGQDFGCEGFIIDNNVYFLTIRSYDLTPKPYRQVCAFYYPAALNTETTALIHGYFKNIVGALDLNNTAFHADFKLNNQNQPILVEIGPRLPGFGLPTDFIPFATGINPFTSLIDISLGNKTKIIPTKQVPTCMQFFQFKPGKVKQIINREELSMLPNIVVLRCNLKYGDMIWPFINGKSAMNNGYVVAIGESIEEAKKRAKFVQKIIDVEYL